jgi:adenine-specific DNA-methyltransferase
LLKKFLRKDGSVWVTLDDTEVHYCKVIMDEIYGRNNFVISIAWQKRTSPDMRAAISDGHDQILVFAQDKERFKAVVNKIPKTAEQAKQYKNPDNDPRGPWTSSDFTAQGYRPNQMYKIKTPGGKIYTPPKGVCWKNVEKVFLQQVADNRIWFGKDGNGMPRRKTFLSEATTQTAWSWWPNTEVGHTQESKKEIHALFGDDDTFETPKPERLIKRVFDIATNPGDLVLDSFLGSGTTAAVALKMGRRFIGVEMGEQAKTHCAVRLKKVIDGEQGGISEAVGWKGGGGFRFYKLGNEVFDGEGHIRQDITFNQLAAHVYFSETKTPMSRRRKVSRQDAKAQRELGLKVHDFADSASLRESSSTFIGLHNRTAYALLYNGVLQDKGVDGGNVLTHVTLNVIKHDMEMAGISDDDYDGIVIYGESTRLPHVAMKSNNITFKQTPYDIKVW